MKSLDQQTLHQKLKQKTAAILFVTIKKKRTRNFCQHDFQCNVQKHCYVNFYEMISCYLNVMNYARSNSSHCQVIDLFKSRESFMKKVDSYSSWICKKMYGFCLKKSKFIAGSSLFIFCFSCLIEDELIHQQQQRKYIENKYFPLPHKKQKNKPQQQKYNPTS